MIVVVFVVDPAADRRLPGRRRSAREPDQAATGGAHRRDGRRLRGQRGSGPGPGAGSLVASGPSTGTSQARAVVSTIPGPTDLATKFVLYRQWSKSTLSAVGRGSCSRGSSSSSQRSSCHSSRRLRSSPRATPRDRWSSGSPRSGWRRHRRDAADRRHRPVGVARAEARGLARAARRPPLGDRSPDAAERDRGQGDGCARMNEKETLSAHGVVGFGAAVLSKLAWFLVLEVSLWAVGSRQSPAPVRRPYDDGRGNADRLPPAHPGWHRRERGRLHRVADELSRVRV